MIRDRSGQMPVEHAEALAIQALAFLAEDPEVIGRFLAETGLGPENLRLAAREPGFLTGVLEYVMGDESLLLVFSERVRIRPTLIAVARNILSKSSGEE
ncbi:DUF3572 domain-containing protein [Methyloraptor flagellatus]|jgi:hypothetical protein|uniref:DUF3572 domain-containing protein n=1 Tax=Methyloraptor flagellatus TaxID=3162530 RepID=A0AAU7XDJ2_9HYPH